jgi:very-short-patch-repair endonuclease
MRHEPTRAESRLWSWLRGRRFGGSKFKRQAPIGCYIVDFFCAELKLAIEVDGRHHDAHWMQEYDGARTAELERRGIRLLRIPNELLMRDSWLVGEQIAAAIEGARKR